MKRIRENLLSVWTLPRVALAARHAANGAPIHLLEDRRKKPSLTAQAGSTCLHALIFAALVYTMTQGSSEELEPQALGSWRGGPPRHGTTVDLLDNNLTARFLNR